MFQITLRMAREAYGSSIEEVARCCGVSIEDLEKYEKDSSDMPISIGKKIRTLYDVPLNLIFIGPESCY